MKVVAAVGICGDRPAEILEDGGGAEGKVDGGRVEGRGVKVGM